MSDIQEPVIDQPAGESQGQPEAEGIYSHTFPDGERVDFKSTEDIGKHLRDSYFRQKDYTKKTQGLADDRKKFDEERSGYEKERDAGTELMKQYRDWDTRLKSNPGLYSRMEQQMRSPASPRDVFEQSKGYADDQVKSLQEQLETIQKEREGEKMDKELDTVFTSFEGQHQDFDRQRVRDLLEELSEGKTEPLIRMLYQADRGMNFNPGKVEQKVVDNLQKKRSAGMVRSGGVAPGKPKKPNTTDAARQAALKDLGFDSGGYAGDE